ncbi:MAG: DUF58 domain-containing protein [Thermoanaerobaculia bacterium]|nr:DUF58 domain-containing protein [Thermoanaerobaculia bacterium]
MSSGAGRMTSWFPTSWSPGPVLLRLLLAWVALGFLAVALPSALPAWQWTGTSILGLCLLAVVQLGLDPGIKVQRDVAPSLPLGEWSTVRIELRTENVPWWRRTPRWEIYDHHPARAETRALPWVLRRGRTSSEWRESVARCDYELRPRRRGAAEFGIVEVWRSSFLDLLRRRYTPKASRTVRVLPNFRPILSEGLAGIEEHMIRSGFHLQRRRGEGLEFQELRDYREGDTLRQVDWKATARRGRLVARQFQEERNQQVVLLLDCGRRMHAMEGDLTHFDHVLDASLLLGYVAHRQGDAIGMQAFAGEERWLPPLRGGGSVNRLLDAIHDLQTTGESPDYSSAAARLMERQKRRALVLLLTNLRDEDAAELLAAVRMLRRRHLVVVASTRELALTALRDQLVEEHRSALEISAAHHYLRARTEAHERVRAAGAFVVDVEPPKLPHALVARYLEIKRAGQL